MQQPDRLDRLIPWLMVATVLAVAVFAFTQSYTHVFFLGQTHHQTGASLRMLPLSVDWLMFAAGLVMLHMGRKGLKHPLPRAALALGATATLVANVASGIIWGWETAAIQAWAPVVLFVAVELGMLLVRTAKAKPGMIEIPIGVARRLEEEERRSNMTEPPFDVPATVADAIAAEAAAKAKRQLTELRQPPQASPIPSGEPDTATIEAVTGSPEDSLSGWGQLGRPEPASEGLQGIGLNNGRK